jgi:hypothetical protein
MLWYTSKMMQDLANKLHRPVFGWIPNNMKQPQVVNGELLWIRDPNGKVKDFKNPDPNFKETDPWEDKYSHKRMWRPD